MILSPRVRPPITSFDNKSMPKNTSDNTRTQNSPHSRFRVLSPRRKKSNNTNMNITEENSPSTPTGKISKLGGSMPVVSPASTTSTITTIATSISSSSFLSYEFQQNNSDTEVDVNDDQMSVLGISPRKNHQSRNNIDGDDDDCDDYSSYDDDDTASSTSSSGSSSPSRMGIRRPSYHKPTNTSPLSLRSLALLKKLKTYEKKRNPEKKASDGKNQQLNQTELPNISKNFVSPSPPKHKDNHKTDYKHFASKLSSSSPSSLQEAISSTSRQSHGTFHPPSSAASTLPASHATFITTREQQAKEVNARIQREKFVYSISNNTLKRSAISETNLHPPCRDNNNKPPNGYLRYNLSTGKLYSPTSPKENGRAKEPNHSLHSTSINKNKGTCTNSTLPSIIASSSSSLPPYKIFVLLLAPKEKIFDLVPITYPPLSTTIGGIIDMIPTMVTEPILVTQTYIGFCRPPNKNRNKNSMMSLTQQEQERQALLLDKNLLASNLKEDADEETRRILVSQPQIDEKCANIKRGEILIAIPQGYTGKTIMEISKPLLANKKVAKLLSRKDPLASKHHRRGGEHICDRSKKSTSTNIRSLDSKYHKAYETATTSLQREVKKGIASSGTKTTINSPKQKVLPLHNDCNYLHQIVEIPTTSLQREVKKGISCTGTNTISKSSKPLVQKKVRSQVTTAVADSSSLHQEAEAPTTSLQREVKKGIFSSETKTTMKSPKTPVPSAKAEEESCPQVSSLKTNCKPMVVQHDVETAPKTHPKELQNYHFPAECNPATNSSKPPVPSVKAEEETGPQVSSLKTNCKPMVVQHDVETALKTHPKELQNYQYSAECNPTINSSKSPVPSIKAEEETRPQVSSLKTNCKPIVVEQDVETAPKTQPKESEKCHLPAECNPTINSSNPPVPCVEVRPRTPPNATKTQTTFPQKEFEKSPLHGGIINQDPIRESVPLSQVPADVQEKAPLGYATTFTPPATSFSGSSPEDVTTSVYTQKEAINKNKEREQTPQQSVYSPNLHPSCVDGVSLEEASFLKIASTKSTEDFLKLVSVTFDQDNENTLNDVTNDDFYDEVSEMTRISSSEISSGTNDDNCVSSSTAAEEFLLLQQRCYKHQSTKSATSRYRCRRKLQKNKSKSVRAYILAGFCLIIRYHLEESTTLQRQGAILAESCMGLVDVLRAVVIFLALIEFQKHIKKQLRRRSQLRH